MAFRYIARISTRKWICTLRLIRSVPHGFKSLGPDFFKKGLSSFPAVGLSP